ncbi:MAG: FAD-binding protein [Proteobacteria bacterium]|nr:FAD-binding protein [Pseudomonadota bacterium]
MSEDKINSQFRMGNKPLEGPEDAEPILPVAPPEKWDHEADLVVVGCGGGGLAGALVAADKGNTSIIIEKMDFEGGTSQYAGAFYAYNSRIQIEAEIEWDVNEVAMGNLFETGYTGDIHMFRNMIKKSGEVVDWMEDKGFEWEIEKGGYPAVTPKGTYDTIGLTRMTAVMNFLAAKGKEKGVKFMISTQVDALVKDSSGRIVGVKATVIPEGKTIFIKANKAVLMAAGGMQHNRTLLKKYAPSVHKGVGSVSMSLPCNTGEAFRMGLGVGADVAGLDSCTCFEGGIDLLEKGGPWFRYLYSGDVQISRAPWLHLNKACKRFMMMDNNLAQYMLRPPAMGAQPGGRAYVVFDNKYEENIWKIQDDVIFGTSCKRPLTTDVAGNKIATRDEMLCGKDWHEGVKEAIGLGSIRVADTLEELAEKLGLDKVLFKEAIEKWNSYCDAGEDPEFNTPERFLIPIKHAPYYGLKVAGSMGPVGTGLRVNEHMQVLNDDQKPIPGLYAAFFTAGGSIGQGRTPMGFGLLGGCSMSTTSGYTAAEHAVSQK